jgi:hypothetical protein
MQGNVNDFLQRFGGGQQTVDDRQAEQYFDRFASREDRDRDFDNDTMYDGATEYLGQLPDDRFERAAYTAYEQAPPQQRQNLLGTLLGAMQGQGRNPNRLAAMLGLKNTDPQQMSAAEYARLANYARREHPQALRETVRQEPGFMKALGNPVVAGALAVVAAKMLQRQRRR